MWTYIVKRLLLLVLTLFLAMCIGFLVTRLAPGDPAARDIQSLGQGGGDKQLSQEIIEDNRRLYGFDKSMFVGLTLHDRNTHVAKTIERLAKPSDYAQKQARIKLSEVNTIALPQLVAAFETATTPTFRNDLAKMLTNITTRNQNLPDFPTDKNAPAQWRKWWDRNAGFFSDAEAQKAAAAFITEPTTATRQAVLARGSLATPFLIPHLDNTERERELTALLSEIQRKIWVVTADTSPEDRERHLFKWRNWWRHNKDLFVVFRGWEGAHRHLTDTQFGIWFSRVLTWDFGDSYEHKRPVRTLIWERLPVSLQLSMISIFIAYIIAIPLGIFSATHQYSKTDNAATVVLFILYSLPSFWVADMLILFLTGGNWWDFFPSRHLHSPEYANLSFWEHLLDWKYLLDWLWHLVLPITCLTYASFAFLSRQMRVSMLDTVRQDFIRTARAKGLSERTVIFKHALRNSMIPILTLLASLLPALLGGSIIIESIFTIDGMGKLSFDAILNRDYPVINAIIFFSSFLTMLGILLSDLSYALVDPRIKYE